MKIGSSQISGNCLSGSLNRRLPFEIWDCDVPPGADRRIANLLLGRLTRERFLGALPSIVAQEQVSSHFKNLQNKDEILKGIDLIWRNHYLFLDDFQEFLLYTLKRVANSNKEFLSGVVNPRNPKRFPSFYIEFHNLLNNSELTSTQRLLAATQAMEMVFMNSNPTEVLRNMNEGGTGSKGFRYELLAGWYLKKFLFASDRDAKSVHSSMFLTYHGASKGDPLKQRVRRSEPFEREVDIATSNSLSSVKTNGNHFSDQLVDLFYVVKDSSEIKDNPMGSLSGQINRFFLFRASANENDLHPNYRQCEDYAKLIGKIIDECSRKISKLYPDEKKDDMFKALFGKLISPETIEIRFIPYVENGYTTQASDWQDGFKAWIEENYKSSDSMRSAYPGSSRHNLFQ